jgi:zinc D-Ala-D-Ala dipeptidase
MNNKILKSTRNRFVFTGIFLMVFGDLSAQNQAISSYGLPVIKSVQMYQKSLLNHPEKQMISLSAISGIILDLRYAGQYNFLHQKLYPGTVINTFLRRPAFMALDSVSKEMARRGFVLNIFDAYRPYGVTVQIWNHVKDERYAANPAKGSGHNRGLSVDLTLADEMTHQLVDMPTGFDNFSDSAHEDFKSPDKKAVANRELLKRVMEKYGFIQLPSEWWHFSWPDENDEFEVLDLSFKELLSPSAPAAPSTTNPPAPAR